MVHRRNPRPSGGYGDRSRVAVAAYSGNNGAPIQPYDQNVWAETFDYVHRDSKESLEFFRAVRARNLALLKGLPKKLWENYGVHQERGKESVACIVRLYAGHDLNHLAQVEKIAKQKITHLSNCPSPNPPTISSDESYL